jgi:hypothetical protein
MITTPKKISKRVKKFISTIGDIGEPEYLTFTCSSERYLSKHCLSNCEAESHFSGCPIVYGWIVWEDKQLRFIEAEFHAVMKRNNKHVDITPRVDGEVRVLFVPDRERTATRLNNREWDTWKNHKSSDCTIESTEPFKIRNSQDDKLF